MNRTSAERMLDAMQYVDEQILLEAVTLDAVSLDSASPEATVTPSDCTRRYKTCTKKSPVRLFGGRTVAYLSLAATVVAVLIAIPLIFKGLGVTEPPQSPPPPNHPSFESSVGTGGEPNEPTAPTETKAPESAGETSDPSEPSQSESETETETERDSTLTEPTEVTK